MINRSRFEGSVAGVALAWGVAIVTTFGAVWSAVPAFAAAPAVDMIIPTNTFNANCAAGQFANRLCLTDNTAVSYYMDSSGTYELESPDRTAVQAALSRWDSNTVLNVAYDSSPVFSGAGETDLIYQEGDTGVAGLVGLTWCDDVEASTAYVCDQVYIRIRGNGEYTETTAAHESGHGFGLTHGQQASPVQDQCDAGMGIMRASLTCLTSPALGTRAVNNINYVY